MPEFHAEPYVYLAGLSHKSALIAWGAFYFKARSDGRAKLVDDEDLQWVHPPRCESTGAVTIAGADRHNPGQIGVWLEVNSGILFAGPPHCERHRSVLIPKEKAVCHARARRQFCWLPQ